MKHSVWFALWLSMVPYMTAGASESEVSVQQDTAYLEQTNGMFAVCVFDRSKATLFRYKGIFVSKEQLPSVSIMRGNLIFASGDRPKGVTNSPAMWKPRSEDLYNYGKIPYPIEEVDPAFELCKTDRSEAVVGFRIRGRFFAVKSIGKMGGEGDQDRKIPILNAKGRLQVLSVRLPQHRENEVKDFIRKLNPEK